MPPLRPYIDIIVHAAFGPKLFDNKRPRAAHAKALFGPRHKRLPPCDRPLGSLHPPVQCRHALPPLYYPFTLPTLQCPVLVHPMDSSLEPKP